MKIKFNTNMANVGDVPTVTIETLDLCGQGLPEGNANGLLPIKLPGGVIVTPQLQITSGTTKSRRGVTSAVIKVSLPYTALVRDTTGESVVVDPKGSAGYVSMHIVLALPQSAVKDLKTSDATISQAAYAQIVAVSQLLRAFVSVGLLERTVALSEGGITGTKSLVDADHPDLEHMLSAKAAMPKHFDAQGSVGLDLTTVGAIPADLGNLVTRVASGLAPLSCGDVDEASVFLG